MVHLPLDIDWLMVQKVDRFGVRFVEMMVERMGSMGRMGRLRRLKVACMRVGST